jgi:hypothetical protein
MLFDINTAPFIDWSKVKFPLIGTGFNRFNLVYRDLPSIEKSSVVYLVNYDDSRKPEELVTVSDDSLSIFDVSEAGQPELQALIETAILGADPEVPNALITRQNISTEEFTGILARYGLGNAYDSEGRAPVWVQRVSAPSSAGDHPAELRLYQNYPNPFNAETIISYMLVKGQKVSIDLFSITGQKIRSIEQGYREAGSPQVTLKAEGLSSGVYMYRISGETVSETRKFVFMR